MAKTNIKIIRLYDGTYSLYAGLIRCGECGKALTIRKTNAKYPQDIYACVTYNRHGKNHCTQHRVEFDTLYNIVFDEIKELAQQTVDADDIADSLADAYANEHEAQRETMGNNIVNAKEKIKTLEQFTTRFYEDLLSGTITQNIFSSMMERTNSEIEELKEQVSKWESEREKRC